MSIFSKEPKGGLARYAYGYTDKKPWFDIVVLICMAAYILWRCFA